MEKLCGGYKGTATHSGIEMLAIDQESTTIHEACFGKKTPVAALLAQ